MSAIFSCREASRLVSQALDRPLVLRERLALGTHQTLCAACRAYRRQIIGLDRLFRRRRQGGQEPLPDSEPLDAAARERIRSKIKQGVSP